MAEYRIKEIADFKDLLTGSSSKLSGTSTNIYAGAIAMLCVPVLMLDVFSWSVKKKSKGYTLQVNKMSPKARILDPQGKCIASGDEGFISKAFTILTCNDELSAGDVIGVKRTVPPIEHYGVYVGNDEVIHYNKDFFGKLCIHKASMDNFLKGSETFFVLDFPDEYGKPAKIPMSRAAVLAFGSGEFFREDFNSIKYKDYHLYSAEETVKRAESRLNETDYNLIVNNCEHFAISCKTGISESHQVNEVLKYINKWSIA